MTTIKDLLTIEDAYREWWLYVSTPDMSDIQVNEMKRAFYSGAQALLFEFMKIDESADADEGADRVEQYRLELKRYFDTFPR